MSILYRLLVLWALPWAAQADFHPAVARLVLGPDEAMSIVPAGARVSGRR
jgi:hypothetical protein